MNTAHWSLGVLIGYPIAGLVLLAALVCIGLLTRIWLKSRKEDRARWDDGPEIARNLAFGGLATALVVSAIVAAASWPWIPEYHQWRPVSGTVEKVGNRVISSGDSISQRYVFRINGQDYGVDDTRAAQVEVGDEVSLSCIREWQYAAESGYACRWGR